MADERKRLPKFYCRSKNGALNVDFDDSQFAAALSFLFIDVVEAGEFPTVFGQLK